MTETTTQKSGMSEETRAKIAGSKKRTRERRKSQVCQVRELKIIARDLDPEQTEALRQISSSRSGFTTTSSAVAKSPNTNSAKQSRYGCIPESLRRGNSPSATT